MSFECRTRRKVTFARLMDWVATCVILHDICIRLGDKPPAQVRTPPSADSLFPLDNDAATAREQILADVLEFMIDNRTYHD